MSKPLSPLHRILNQLPGKTRAEIIGGQLIVQPPPAVRHNRVARKLSAQLDARFGADDGSGGWVILLEPGVTIPVALRTSDEHEFVEPDLAGWRRTRMAEEPDVTFIDIAPDWVCEVLSGNAKHDRIVKAPLYAAMNVQHLWLIDPKALTLEVYTQRDRVYEQTLTARGADMVRAAPFEELELSLATLWLKPPA